MRPWSWKIVNMIKTVRKGSVQDQDVFRRASMKLISPTDRINVLVKARDLAFPHKPLKKVARLRKLR